MAVTPIRWLGGVVLAGIVCSLMPGVAAAMQESGTESPLGKLTVAPKVMAGRCITMVSPMYPQSAGVTAISTVVVRVVVSASGRVSPVEIVSGDPGLQAEAMNAVRLWRYRPFVREDTAMDVVTDVRVLFEPGKPGGMISHPNH